MLGSVSAIPHDPSASDGIVTRELDLLFHQVDSLEQILVGLTNRINPILSGSKPHGESSDKEAEIDVPIANSVRDIRIRLSVLTTIAADALERVAL